MQKRGCSLCEREPDLTNRTPKLWALCPPGPSGRPCHTQCSGSAALCRGLGCQSHAHTHAHTQWGASQPAWSILRMEWRGWGMCGTVTHPGSSNWVQCRGKAQWRALFAVGDGRSVQPCDAEPGKCCSLVTMAGTWVDAWVTPDWRLGRVPQPSITEDA